MLSVLLAPFTFPSRDVVTRLPTRRTRSCVPVANAPAELWSGSVDYTSEQQRAREWYNTWIKTRSLQNTIRHASVVAMAPVAEMPAVLAEWGCDETLWAKVRNKKALLDWAATGDEAKARERIRMLKHSRSVLGISTPMPAMLKECGCDEELWAQIRSKATLTKLAEAGDEAQVRAKLEQIRALVAEEKAKPAAAPAAPAPPKEWKRGGDKSVPVDAEKIADMLRRRGEAQKARDFDAADAIREEIRAMGVDVFDKQKEWRVRRKGRRQNQNRSENLEMPAKLAEWGCDAELWGAIKSKGALLKLLDNGNEEYARKRLERMRELVASDAAA